MAEESSLVLAGVLSEVGGVAQLLINGLAVAQMVASRARRQENQNRTRRSGFIWAVWKVPATLASV